MENIKSFRKKGNFLENVAIEENFLGTDVSKLQSKLHTSFYKLNWFFAEDKQT